MSSSEGVTVESVNSIDAGMMRQGRSHFEFGFKILGLWQTGYLFIVGHYGDDFKWIKYVSAVRCCSAQQLLQCFYWRKEYIKCYQCYYSIYLTNYLAILRIRERDKETVDQK